MKTQLISILILATGCFVASAQYEQYVTITVAPPQNPPTANYVTNTFTINQNQAAEIMSVRPILYNSQYTQLTVSNNGAVFNGNTFMSADGYAVNYVGQSVSPSKGTIIQGPATFTLSSSGGANAFLTLKIIPESYDPNKTLIVAPGTNQVQITLQVSPDLVNWTTATNGIYGSPTTAQFFRIREDNLVSP